MWEMVSKVACPGPTEKAELTTMEGAARVRSHLTISTPNLGSPHNCIRASQYGSVVALGVFKFLVISLAWAPTLRTTHLNFSLREGVAGDFD